ncbi:FadR/GntR family transcriptional regulator [Thalassotalea sp. PLHSN55]|uniref:FadR/GntR family transcriptional regulator n=1 Tax=Thalassotalea sp. PLHSN55 TaxID=3435888 RepID=UPI003F83512E
MKSADQFKVIKTDRLYIKVAEQLTTLIENGVFKVGDKFPAERALAEKLGVSRPTIREAMIALEISGLIEIRTGSGIYVTENKVKDDTALIGQSIGPFEVLEMRYILEPEICALAAARVNDQQVEQLKDIIKEMEAATDAQTFEDTDCKLHNAIAQMSQNSALQASIAWLWKLRNESVLKNLVLEAITKEGLCIEEHKKIVNAIAQKNPEKARLAMKNHLDNATTTIDFEL